MVWSDYPCLEWTGARIPDGYGMRQVNKKSWLVHRLAWTEAHGPIPPGTGVLHHCDNPPCYEVQHLFLGNQAANMRDAREKNRLIMKLSESDVVEIRRLLTEGTLSHRLIAERFGVTRSNVTAINRGKSWM